MTAYKTEYERRFPELSYLMGAYFNQDWGSTYDWEGAEPNFRAVVRHFKSENPSATIIEATRELEQFLALSLAEEEIEEALDDMASAYYPPSDGLNYRQWLEAVLDTLQEAPDKARAMRVIG